MELTDDIFGGGTPNYGAMGQQSEKKRQGIINLGMQQLNAVYGGGSAPFYTMANSQPLSKGAWNTFGKNQTYYQQNKKGVFSPYYAPKNPAQVPIGVKVAQLASPNVPGDPSAPLLTGLSTGDWKKAGQQFLDSFKPGAFLKVFTNLFAKDPLTPRELVNRKTSRGQLFNAPETKTFKGYQPEFYQAREKAYTDFALPQLSDQYQNARENSIYGLSNVGLSGSSVDTKQKFKLEKAMNSGRQNVAEEGINQSNQLKNQVEQSRQQAIQQLYQTGDPSQALKTAINTSAGFERPGGFNQLANGFGDVMNQFYIQKLLQGYQNPVGGGQESQTYFAPTR